MYDWLEAYCKEKAGVTTYYKEDWNWQRYFVGGKLFADVGIHQEEDGARIALFVTLSCEPAYGDLLCRQYRAAAPGFYTNKERNITIWFDPNNVPEKDRNNARGLPQETDELPPDAIVREAVDRAYQLAFSKLTKKAQKELVTDE